MKEKAQAMARLLGNDDFQKLILEDFIKGGILHNGLKENVFSENTQRELYARQCLASYIDYIISYNSNDNERKGE